MNWLADAWRSARDAGKLTRKRGPLDQGSDEIVPGTRAAPIHRDPPEVPPREQAPLDTEPDPPSAGGPRD